jgi:mannose-1-phosphate guanylyltransferase
MRAILLAAGLGTRLRPLTDSTPKCLVSIKGRPLLEIWLERLILAGIGPLLINTHYLSNRVEEFILSNPLRDQVKLVYEPELMGTAGTLIANLDFFGLEDGMLIHADNYCLADLNGFMRAHQNRPPECLMTMMTFRTPTPSTCGIVEINAKGIVVGFHEKMVNPPGNLANGAIYILSNELLIKLGTTLNSASDFSTEVIVHLLGRIFSYETTEVFMDIGTPGAYMLANK